MALACTIIDSVFDRHGKEFTITSAIDGKHSRASKHYSGAAIDARTRHLLTSEADKITIDIKASLGADFDVVLETDHLHIEYDPKTSY